MSISASKLAGQLPTYGTPVITKVDPEVSRTSECFFVNPKHIAARMDAPGRYAGFVPGCGGDVWWIDHGGGKIGAYLFTEVEDRPVASA